VESLPIPCYTEKIWYHFSPLLLPPLPLAPNLLESIDKTNKLPLTPTHSPPPDQATIPTLYKPNTLQSLTQTPYTTTTKIHPNTYKCHKTQKPLHLIPHSPTPFPVSPFSATLSNSPKFYS
jgi:hypothetical protein